MYCQVYGYFLLCFRVILRNAFHIIEQECQTHFHWGPHQPCVAFKGPNVTLELYNVITLNS